MNDLTPALLATVPHDDQTPEAAEAIQAAAEEQAAKDRELLAALQQKLGQMVTVRPIRPNRAMRRAAVRHAKRNWTPPMTARAHRERRALARKGIFVQPVAEA